MAFSGNFMPTSFKVQILKGVHNFSTGSGQTFKLALYTNSATFNAGTTAYVTTNEVVGIGYTVGGGTLTKVTPTNPSGTTAVTDFADLSYATATITARGALIYNDTATGANANAAVAVLDFLTDKTSTAGTFTIVFPSPTATGAIIRIA